MVEVLNSAIYPARNAEQNIADLRAQLAANEKGVQELHKMVRQFGLETVLAYMTHVQEQCRGRSGGDRRPQRWQLHLSDG